MQIIKKIAIYGSIFFLSWTDSFSIGSKLTLSNICILSLVFIFLFEKTIGKNKELKINILKIEDLLLFIGVLFVGISGLINPNSKTINYIGAYFYVFIITFIFLKIILYQNVKYKEIFITNTIAIIFLSFFLLLEFVLGFFMSFDIQQYIPRHRETSAIFNGLPRSYGFATEPGVVAYYLNTLGPIAFYSLWNLMNIGFWKKLFYSVVLVLGWVTTFSAAGIGFLLIGIIVFCLSKIFSLKFKLVKKHFIITLNITLVSFVILLIIVSYNNNMNTIFNFIEPMKQKIAFDTSVGSSTDRLGRWNTAIDMIVQNPIVGIGPGMLSYSGLGSPTNWYLFLTLEGGLVTILPFLLFLFISLVKILKSKIEFKSYFLIGFMAGVGHLSVISTFQYVFLWFLILLFNIANEQSSKNKNFEPGAGKV